MYTGSMVALQIKNVPQEQRDALAERAISKGQSLQAYLRELIEREARFASNVDLARNFAVEGFSVTSDDIVEAARAAKGYDASAPGHETSA